MRTVRASTNWTLAALAGALWLAMLWIGNLAGAPNQGLFRSLYVGGGHPLLDATMVFTRLGGWVVLSTLAVLGGLFLIWRRRPTRAALLLLTIFSGRLLVEFQKLFFAHPRPDATEHLVRVSSMSFPSGHAANAMITLVALAAVLPMPPRLRVPAMAAAVLLSLLIGVSRIALGVHWPADVLGGWGFGLFWVLLCLGLARARNDADPADADASPRHGRARSFILRVREKRHVPKADAKRPGR